MTLTDDQATALKHAQRWAARPDWTPQRGDCLMLADLAVALHEKLRAAEAECAADHPPEPLYLEWCAQRGRAFKRASDPHGCPYREGPTCAGLGVISYCKLPEGHEGRHATESATSYHLAQWAKEA